jgi:hypothetical protein
VTTTEVPTTHLPVTKEIKDLLTGLLGREVTLAPTSPLAPSTTSPRSVAVYVDDHLGCRAVIACDLAFSAHAAAALALLPVPVAEEAVAANALDEALAENLYEVLNVAAALFNAPGAVHVRLLELHAAGQPVPPAVLGRMLTLGRREDLEVEVAGYGTGRLSVVICG